MKDSQAYIIALFVRWDITIGSQQYQRDLHHFLHLQLHKNN
nr:MAG TPA: hypothetical protein [Siphoviridae sp. ct7ub6]